MAPNNTIRNACFLESDPQLSLVRRGVAEFIGTFLLVLVIIGGQLNASHGKSELNDLVVAVAAGGALSGLILALGAISGGHFNPLITILQWTAGLRNGLCTLVYVVAQIAGGIAGGTLATTAFGQMSKVGGPGSPGNGWLLAETLFSAGLLIVVFGCMKSDRKEFGALAVGAWLTASSVCLPNTFGNPALAMGAKFGMGLVVAWRTVTLAILTELGGAALAAWAIAFLFPRLSVGIALARTKVATESRP